MSSIPLPDDVDAWFESLPDQVALAARAQFVALTDGWEVGEWTRSSYDLDETITHPLDAVVDEMGRVRRAVRDGDLHHDDPAVLKYMTWQVGAIAMAILFEDGFFDGWAVAVQVFGVSDEALDAQTRIEWIEMCNPDEATVAFVDHVRRG